ncbi:putative solute carrier organic anion transporter family member 2A1 [Apostichopus japonicus]|uniref:Putative solute carrier organic anion transporter family member 2A1 n=1 Tax=Stichopus japonicus TaxID=307972 RepID=A0A2G8LF31_STIJA|nr:putative solute carrier organic anion transporter family member 2A1 [Apostichopus japonicus]
MPYSGSGQSSPSTRRSNAAYQPTVEDSPPVARREMGLFDNPKMFTAFVWLANIGLAASVTYLGACTSTLEKRFQLKSSQTAFFFTVTDIVGLFTVLFVIYYGQKRNRARVLGALYLICACGSFVCSIPHYLYSLPAALDPATQSNYTGENGEDRFCTTETAHGSSDSEHHYDADDDDCDNGLNSESGALVNQAWWILLGQVLTSFSSAVFPLIVSCIDDKVSNRNSAMYIAVLFTTFPIGATLGYMIAFMCLGLPVSFPFDTLETYPIGPDDPRWVGAWWLGFVVSGCMEGSVDDKNDTEMGDVSLSFHMPNIEEDEGITGFVKGLLKSVLRVLRNFTVMAMILATCANTASLAGGRAFGPKYIQNQFNLDASRAALLTGVVVIPAAFIGTLSGGCIIRAFNLQNKGKAMMILVLHIGCFFTTIMYLFIGCPNTPTAGLTAPYESRDSYSSSYVAGETPSGLDHMCNNDCDCTVNYQPVCGSDGITYITPCHAGCKSQETWEISGKNSTVFIQCSCVPIDLSNDFYQEDEGLVEERDRSVMMGISSVFMKVLGFIPGPIYFGASIEKACQLFQTSCGKTGNCILYDLPSLRFHFYGLIASLRAIDLFFAILVFLSVWVFKKTLRIDQIKYVETYKISGIFSIFYVP